MHVFPLVLAGVSIFVPRADINVEAAGPTTTGLRDLVVAPVSANNHEDLPPNDLLGSNGPTNTEERMNLVESEDVAHQIESAASSALESKTPEHVLTEAFDAFVAAHPGFTLEDAAMSKRLEMIELRESFAQVKQLHFEKLLPGLGEVELAKSLAGMQKSQNEMVKAFGKEYLQVLTTKWADNQETTGHVLAKLGIANRYSGELLQGETPADVVLKAYCNHVYGDDGMDRYYRTISLGFGGTRQFLTQLVIAVLHPQYRDRILEFMIATMKFINRDKQLPLKGVEYLDQFVEYSDLAADSPNLSHSRQDIIIASVLHELKQLQSHQLLQGGVYTYSRHVV